MPLAPCPECGRELSADAKACPGCGALTAGGRHARDVRRGQVNIISVVVLVVVAAYLFDKYRHLMPF